MLEGEGSRLIAFDQASTEHAQLLMPEQTAPPTHIVNQTLKTLAVGPISRSSSSSPCNQVVKAGRPGDESLIIIPQSTT